MTVAAPEAWSPASSFSFPAFAAVADRLEQVIDGETAALEGNTPCDLAAACHGKRLGLLELSRFLPRATAPAEQAAARQRLDGLAAKLERNQRALHVHLCAVREIADIIGRAMRDADSDGTYSVQGSRR